MIHEGIAILRLAADLLNYIRLATLRRHSGRPRTTKLQLSNDNDNLLVCTLPPFYCFPRSSSFSFIAPFEATTSSEPCILPSSMTGPSEFLTNRHLCLWIALLPQAPCTRLQRPLDLCPLPNIWSLFRRYMEGAYGLCMWFSSRFELACAGLAIRLVRWLSGDGWS